MTFSFNGISSDDLGIIVTKTVMPPASYTQYDIMSVPGRELPLWTQKTERQQITISVQTTIIEPDKLRTIYTVLQGKGTLILSTEPTKYYVGSVEQLIPENIALYVGTLPISFICEPFAYSLNNPLTEYSTRADVEVSGTHYSEPLIKIYGNGNITLTVNGEVWSIADVDGYITIDTKRRLVYKDSTVLLNKVTRADGRVHLPYFNVGINRVIAGGTVSKMEIQKNERWL